MILTIPYYKKITRDQIWIHDNWITVDGVGRIGLYQIFDKTIGLDYSMKWIVGSNEPIPCSHEHNEIKDKIMELFNGKDSGMGEDLSPQSPTLGRES